MTAVLVAVAIVLAVVLAVAGASIRILREYERAVVFRLQHKETRARPLTR
jgi:regulator of protease activity HflC (stomatin/prohibitin superfamily)